MKREPGFAAARWDDPFWHVVRMLADQSVTKRGKYASAIAPHEIISVLSSVGTPVAGGLISYLKNHDGVLDRLSAYWSKRREVADSLLALMRTEEQAKADYAGVSDQVLQSYGVKLEGYHKSSKALVNTVDAIVYRECRKSGVPVDTNPQSRAALVSDEHIWVSPRRLDGAIPGLLNPVAIWEIKEYWGKTGGGSKMSDAIYELHLVGLELRMFEDEFKIHVNHYAIMDGKDQWNSRKSDIRRAVDLLYSGILDELVVGREVLTEWPRIVSECSALVTSNENFANGGESPNSLF
ncbi:hypothetical protein [Streptomyces alfalfae]|uniref:DUF7687 domain-containing protein n=1 Tax=Streptomyces alfalfae TaxID=1642299 RepID=A0A7T4PIB9_9ACTN|nr:hypothetical protein [Streptomyces alfalfae]QQC90594.1 hypothetical protein I8755_20935 [Streptomyces alfalfae]